MAEPRRYLRGATYMFTRRTLLRQYLMRPDKRVSEIWLYSLAVWAQRHHVDVHGFTLMSTYERVTATDPRGVMGHFLRDFHRTVAKAMKALHRMDGNFWEDTPPSVVHLPTHQAFVEKSGYQIANPVEAGAVSHSRQWPGAIVHADGVGNKRVTVSTRLLASGFQKSEASRSWCIGRV